MNALTVGTLNAAQHGQSALVAHPCGRVDEGVLMLAPNPSYNRRVEHWWLLVQSASARFDRDALSLQWSGSSTVELIERGGVA